MVRFDKINFRIVHLFSIYKASPNETNLISDIKTIKEDYPKVIIQQLLNAIRLESYEARQRFPRLLQIIELYPESVKLFIQEVN
jgi:hypothetical protein